MIRVLVVDDSAVIRQVLTAELSRHPGIIVIGSAPDPFAARDILVRESPDVMTLDIEMPRMDGVTFLRKIMAVRPIPTVVVSSLAPAGSEQAIAALAAGAVEVLCKPDSSYELHRMAVDLCAAVERAARSRVEVRTGVPVARLSPTRSTSQVVAIGASTGGVAALETVITAMPQNAPGMVIVQHMPAGFTRVFAERLAGLCAMDVGEAEDGDAVAVGRVLIAPGDRHMEIVPAATGYRIQLSDGPRVGQHKPAIDVLFRSVARVVGSKAIGVMLTGMGRDGAEAMKLMHDAGAMTIAQDEASCVVYGMPREAVAAGAVDEILPLDRIAARVLAIAEQRGTPSARYASVRTRTPLRVEVLPPESHRSPLVDPDTTRNLRDLGRDGASAIDLFLGSLPDQLARLATAGGDVQMLRSIAHALKGAASTVGALALSCELDRLERLARSGNGAEAQRLLPTVRSTADATCAALRSTWRSTP